MKLETHLLLMDLQLLPQQPEGSRPARLRGHPGLPRLPPAGHPPGQPGNEHPVIPDADAHWILRHIGGYHHAGRVQSPDPAQRPAGTV